MPIRCHEGAAGYKAHKAQSERNLNQVTQQSIIFSLLRQWYDLLYREGDQNNFLSVTGFLVALRDVLRVKRGGVVWIGHPCNPFLKLD